MESKQSLDSEERKETVSDALVEMLELAQEFEQATEEVLKLNIIFTPFDSSDWKKWKYKAAPLKTTSKERESFVDRKHMAPKKVPRSPERKQYDWVQGR